MGSDANEGMDVLARREHASKEPRPYVDFQQKVWPVLKVCLSLSRSGSKAVSSHLRGLD